MIKLHFCACMTHLFHWFDRFYFCVYATHLFDWFDMLRFFCLFDLFVKSISPVPLLCYFDTCVSSTCSFPHLCLLGVCVSSIHLICSTFVTVFNRFDLLEPSMIQRSELVIWVSFLTRCLTRYMTWLDNIVSRGWHDLIPQVGWVKLDNIQARLAWLWLGTWVGTKHS
jgi:hypothetical protein